MEDEIQEGFSLLISFDPTILAYQRNTKKTPRYIIGKVIKIDIFKFHTANETYVFEVFLLQLYLK